MVHQESEKEVVEEEQIALQEDLDPEIEPVVEEEEPSDSSASDFKLEDVNANIEKEWTPNSEEEQPVDSPPALASEEETKPLAEDYSNTTPSFDSGRQENIDVLDIGGEVEIHNQ